MALDGWLFAGFILALCVVAYVHRHRLATQKIIGNLVYITLYRSKVGIDAMKAIASRFAAPIRWATPWIIGIGFLGMAVVSVEILASLYTLLADPASAAGVALVLPIKAKGVFFVPFIYWIISIFVVVVVHEGAHGVLAVANKVRIKSSGLAALSILVPIVPAAFVEPDERSLARRSPKGQLAVFAAGPIANIALAVVLAGVILGITVPLVDRAYQKDGLRITGLVDDKTLPAYAAGLAEGMVITGVDGVPILDLAGFQEVYKGKKPGEEILLTVLRDRGSKEPIDVTSTLAESKEKPGEPYLGVFFDQEKHLVIDAWWVPILEWFSQLLVWISAMNLGVGLFNLLPLGIVDGGRMLHVALHRFLRETHAKYAWAAVSGFFFFAVVGSLVIGAVR